MEIESIEMSGMVAALTALRLPFGLDVRSEIYSKVSCKEFSDVSVGYCGDAIFDPRDLKLMSTLIKRGDEHAKVMRGVVVYAKITAPVFWWCEMECYRAGHERLCSESTMHIDCKGLQGEELQKAKAEIPMGKELTKVDMFSYQCLRNIVKQRHNHRLPEWHQFVDWVRTLPFAEELILVGLNLEENE